MGDAGRAWRTQGVRTRALCDESADSLESAAANSCASGCSDSGSRFSRPLLLFGSLAGTKRRQGGVERQGSGMSYGTRWDWRVQRSFGRSRSWFTFLSERLGHRALVARRSEPHWRTRFRVRRPARSLTCPPRARRLQGRDRSETSYFYAFADKQALRLGHASWTEKLGAHSSVHRESSHGC